MYVVVMVAGESEGGEVLEVYIFAYPTQPLTCRKSRLRITSVVSPSVVGVL